MKVGDILNKLLERRVDRYKIHYDVEFEKLTKNFVSTDKIKSISISSILLITDNHPRSLITIAYALQLTQSLNIPLCTFSQNIHGEMIKQEAKELGISLTILDIKLKITIDKILEAIRTHKAGLVIIPYNHEWRKDIQAEVSIPILFTKVDPFSKASILLKL